MMLDFYGETSAIRHARKHLGWYLERFAPALPAAEKAAIMTSHATREVVARRSVPRWQADQTRSESREAA